MEGPIAGVFSFTVHCSDLLNRPQAHRDRNVRATE